MQIKTKKVALDLCSVCLPSVCLRHHELGAVRCWEAEHLCRPGDALSDPQFECVGRGGSGDLSRPRPLLPLPWGESPLVTALKRSKTKCHICMCFSAVVNVAAVSSVPVFQLQRAADAAGLLSVPADQQHREAGPHGAHPVQLPAAGGVATSSTVGQCGPLCHLQCHVRAKQMFKLTKMDLLL